MKKAETKQNLASASKASHSSEGRSKVAVVLIVLAIIVVAVVGFFVLKHYFFKPNNQPVPQAGQTFSQREDSELARAEAAVDETKNATSAADKEAAAANYVELGNVQINKERYDDAIESYKKALDLSDSVKQDALDGLFYAYEENGQPKEAIKTGEELIAYLKTTVDESPFIQVKINRYQNEVNRVKGGKKL